MAHYRVYLHAGQTIQAQHDFDADDDTTALWIGTQLCDACSDLCDDFELWEATRRVVNPEARPVVASAAIREATQAKMVDTENASQRSDWAIARSQRLLQRLTEARGFPRAIDSLDAGAVASEHVEFRLQKMIRRACEIADAHAASLFLVDGRVLRPYIIYNLPEEYIAGIGEVRVGSQCCGRAVESKRPWVVTDMHKDPLFAEGRDGAMKSAIRAAFSVPVFEGSEVIASLACHYIAPHTPSEVDIGRNQHFARLIAITLKGRGPIASMKPVFASAALAGDR